MRGSELLYSKGLGGLFGAQFLGALNDHAFKTMVSLIIVGRGLADGGAAEGLSILGAVFVLPYVLLSGLAGRIADRFDTRHVLIATKMLEIPITMLAAFALLDGRSWVLVGSLALLSAQSVFFSPAKYKLLSLHHAGQKLVRANGVLELSRYMAIIAGTALGGASLGFSKQAPGLIGSLIVLAAVAGTACALLIPGPHKSDLATPRGSPARKSLRQSFKDLRRLQLFEIASILTLLEMVGTTLMFALLLFASAVLKYNETETGMLAASAGIGVSLGAILAGAGSRGAADFRPARIGAAMTAGAILLLPHAAQWLWLAPPLVLLTGAGGGAILVVLNTVMQTNTPAAQRGRLIAANNFLNMLGVLSASGVLWLMGEALGMQPAHMLYVLASAVLVIATWLGLLEARRKEPARPAPALPNPQ